MDSFVKLLNFLQIEIHSHLELQLGKKPFMQSDLSCKMPKKQARDIKFNVQNV